DGVTVDDLRRLLEDAQPLALASDPAGEGVANGGEGSTDRGQDLLADLVERAKADVGAAFEETVLRQLAGQRIRDRAGFIRLRAELKAAANVPLGELDRALAGIGRKIDHGEDGDRVYLDLCDPDWRAVEIGPDGWRIIANPPIRFRRTAGMLPLPLPEPGGSLENLRPFLNVRPKTTNQRTLGSSWRPPGC